MTHTPGSWTIVGNAIEAQQDGYGLVIASVYDEREVAFSRAEFLANARLIAAAPELLAALRVAANEIKEVSKYHALNSWEIFGPQIDAAIAKADGKAH